MGKQVGFFMTYGDELAFLSAIQKELGPLAVVANTAKTERGVISSLEPANPFTTNLSLLPADSLTQITSTYISAQNLYCVDLLNSEVVQFNRCKPMNGWMASGRLWFEENRDDGKKSSEFRNWAKKLLSWFSKNWDRSDDGFYFIGPEARKLAQEGK